MTTPISTSDRQIYRHPKAVVSIADALRDQDFVEVPYLRCETLRIACGPEIDQARLTYEYGYIRREDATGAGVTHYDPLSLNGKFCKVVIRDTVYDDAFAEDPETDVSDETITWFGFIEYDSRSVGGSTPDPDNAPMGTQQFMAFGLMRLLDKEAVRTSMVDTDGTGAGLLSVKSGLTFNADPSGQFVLRGNRSTSEIDGSYVFSWSPRGGDLWNANTALEYLLKYHSPQTTGGVAANVWRLDTVADYLDWFDITEKTDGRSVKQLVDALIPRFRAVSYWCYFDITRTDPEDPETAKNEIVISVFSFLKTDITLDDGQILRANPDQYSLDFEHAYDIESASVGNASTQLFHRIIARGAKRTTTFTARIAPLDDWDPDKIIGPSWTEADELEYKAGASGAADYSGLDLKEKQARNAVARTSDRLREVFRRYVLNTKVAAEDRWNGKIPHPHSTASTDSWWLRGDQGTSPFSALVDPEADYDGTDYVPGLKVMRGLPLLERYDYSGTRLEEFDYLAAFTDETHPSYIPLLAYARTTEGDAEVLDLTSGQTPHRYEYVDRFHQRAFDQASKRDWSCRVGVTDTEPGIEIVADVPHFLGGPLAGSAGEGYTETADRQLSSKHGGVNYTDIWVTLCVELSEHAEQSVLLDEPADDAPENVLILHFPDARHDYVIPHTTVEVKDGLPVETTSGGATRDDLGRLQAMAMAAAQWYSTVRQSLELDWKQIRATFKLGWLITDVGGRYQILDVNTPITAITYQLGREHGPGQITTGATTIETAFTNLDFAGRTGERFSQYRR